jgi:hypothetical protein
MATVDIFQFFSGSADAAPGKGTGETLVSSPDVYKDLKAVKGWRKSLAVGDETFLAQILPLTGSAQLWEAPPKKSKVHRMDLEEKRASLKQNGNVVELSEEMSAPRSRPMTKAQKEAAAVAAQAQVQASGAAAAGGGGEVPAVAPSAAAPVAPRRLPSRRANAGVAADLASRIGVGAAASSAAGGGGAAAPAARAVAPPTTVFPESILAMGAAAEEMEELDIHPPDMGVPEKNKTSMKFCPVCRYYLYLQIENPNKHAPEEQSLNRICRNCGFTTEEEGGLLSEILVQERSSESYKILVNEFTHLDPCNPHIIGVLKCPRDGCPSNVGQKESDIIYLQYDKVNLLYIYICNVCQMRWHSKR